MLAGVGVCRPVLDHVKPVFEHVKPVLRHVGQCWDMSDGVGLVDRCWDKLVYFELTCWSVMTGVGPC